MSDRCNFLGRSSFRQAYVAMYAQRTFAYQRLGERMNEICDHGRAIEMGRLTAVAARRLAGDRSDGGGRRHRR